MVGLDPPRVGVDLWWLPLGAGGHFVRMNGRIYEAMQARQEGRTPADLYHTALEVRVPSGRFVVENAWPVPDADSASRGVVIEGPVFAQPLSHFRWLRYEVRRWRDGVIFDAAWAVASPHRVSSDVLVAERLLDLVPSVPALVWGRDDSKTGEMWNSNSVIAWLLASADVPLEGIHPPSGGRAPGWGAGIAVATRDRDLVRPSDLVSGRRRVLA